MSKNFDLSLNKWGPYNKEYLGVAHVANEELGSTFQVELFPGFFRRKIMASHSCSDEGLKMWGANAELTRFAYRYELEWKDRVYCDVDFAISGDKKCEITCTFVNNTEFPQSLNMNLCASLQYPIVKNGRLPERYRIPFEAILPEGCVFVDAIDYAEICCAETLASDGRYLGEFLLDGATGKATVLAQKYFSKNTHYVRYNAPIDAKGFLIRYNTAKDTILEVRVGSQKSQVKLSASDGFLTAYVECEVAAGETVELRPTECGVNVDCLVFGKNADKTEFRKMQVSTEAKREIRGNSMVLRYPYVEHSYTIEWHESAQMVRRYYYTDIGKALSVCVHDHVSSVLRESNPLGVYENVMSEPLFLAPNESRCLHFTVSSDADSTNTKPEPLYELNSNPDGKPYAFSQNMMAYNTLLNVVYPIYTRRGYIRHNTPGRNWDSLYSWDSGFIGMGLGVVDFERGYDCLNTYLTPVGDAHSPYIFHGSVVPTQIFLYQYLFNKYPEQRERLLALYPMVHQMFNFFAKMDERDGQMASGLLKTWDIFYNSGGWDDYPPQKYLHKLTRNGCKEISTDNTAPVVTSAITVLIAKILRGIYLTTEDASADEYDNVIEKYSKPILNYAWNNETGYFSYVVHDEKGMPKEFLKAPDGSDHNQGFDGIYPYIAGITDENQSQRILDNVKNGLMTPIGVGVVDTRASYYYSGGYWNGSVWMPHQWVLFMSLLDHGEGELAFKIADIALEIWKRETDNSYCCFEHFMSANGRGSGFHQFSGLSTPVMMFFESYYTPATVTVGFETLILDKKWNEDATALTMKCRCGGERPIAVICMKSGREYIARVNGVPAKLCRVTDGAYEVVLPRGDALVEVFEK